MFSSTSYADWTLVSDDVSGNIYFVDFERIRKHQGSVYWWDLINLLKPDKQGNLSYKSYIQGDCKLIRVKVLSVNLYREPMGEGTPHFSSNKPDKNWGYPSPNSSNETILKRVCEYAK